MAERRMFAKTIIDSDLFLDMPLSTQCLYFHLSMRADDDGFINNPKKIQRMIGCNDDDLKVLISKQFIIPFESGIVVIKHWKIHNYIRSDRYKETIYLEEKSNLIITQNKEYELGIPNDNQVVYQEVDNRETVGIPNGYSLDTQARLGKARLGQVSLGKASIETARESDSINTVDTVDNIDSLEGFDVDAVFILNHYLPNISIRDKKRILTALKETGNDIYYLEEKIFVLKERDNINSIAGFLVKAIKDDYKLKNGAC